jgi:lysophospholipase L1-like esterase
MRMGWDVARVLLALAVSVGLTLAGPAQATAAPLVGPPGEYVALGDSYVAGPGIPVQTGQPIGCSRSDHDYPSLVRQAVRPEGFRDVSCTGATTKEMTAVQRTSVGTNPPQLDALSDRTDLVTLGIGGNDIGFVEIINTCARLSAAKPTGAACRDHYTTGGRDQLAERVAATAPKVAAVLAEVERRAPDAQVLVVGYPTILPAEGPGCYPVVPFSPGDVAYLRGLANSLNGMLAAQAEQADAEFVDTARSSVGHDVCALPGVKWVEGLVPTSPAAPVHPNARGMRNSADQVLTALHVDILANR